MPKPPPVRLYPRAVPPETDDDYVGTSCRDATTYHGFFLYPDAGISEGRTYVTSKATIAFTNADTKVRTIVDSEGILWGGGEVADGQHTYDVLPGKTLALKTVTVNQEKAAGSPMAKGLMRRFTISSSARTKARRLRHGQCRCAAPSSPTAGAEPRFPPMGLLARHQLRVTSGSGRPSDGRFAARG